MVERDAAGRPTGLLQEQAQALVRALVYPYPQAELVEAIGRASEHYLREGLTSVQEAGVGGGLVARSPVELSAWQEARRQGRLGVRATLMVAAEALHDLPHARRRRRRLRPRPRPPHRLGRRVARASAR